MNDNQWKIAASVIAGLLLSVSVLLVSYMRSADRETTALQQRLAASTTPKVVSKTFALNAAGANPTILPRPKPGQLWALSVRATNGQEYSVHIDDADKQRLWTWSTLSLNTMPNGRLSVLIGHDTLVPGEYTLYLVASSGTTTPYPFTLR